ncbi:MAG: imelysin family protein [Pseudomonadota bacterium]
MHRCWANIKPKHLWSSIAPAGSKAGLVAAAALVLAACGEDAGDTAAQTFPLAAESATPIVTTYADIALAVYEDSYARAGELSAAIDALVESPTTESLAAARAALLDARVPYQQSEVFRFGNPLVDDWEGRVNAWPLDEGLIDYVDPSYGQQSDANPLYTVNVIANEAPLINGAEIDATSITAALLTDVLHEAGSIEANVATGYHAIEFLLWGQDLNGTADGAGDRPASDFAVGENCTGGNCERRIAYLQTATQLLLDDLDEMVSLWNSDGAARQRLLDDSVAGVNAIISGMGSLSYGELAGERMKLGLVLHDPEEEHDCFSDNTHNSHYYNQVGIANVYWGEYERIDGTVVKGASLSALAADKLPALAGTLDGAVGAATDALTALKQRGDSVEAYDQMIGEGNADGQQTIEAAVEALVAQTQPLEQLVAALELGSVYIEGSDSLDDPSAVFQ